jgi:CO/xanthine dehydrogenase Mo-binding subunit
MHWGTGTFASRGAVVAGNACHEAALAVRGKIARVAGEHFKVPADEIVLAGGAVHVRGSPEVRLALGALAAKANPLRGAVKPGTEPGLEATRYFGPERGSTANGVHAMIVEVDRDTATLTIRRYVVVHDCGMVINPLLVDGQIHGGVAMGIGQAFFERLAWGDDGVLLNPTLRNYLLPSALDVPQMHTEHVVTPSPLNPLGVKGVGEAGAIPVGALFAQALDDALADVGLEILEMPLSPDRLFALMQTARAGDS